MMAQLAAALVVSSTAAFAPFMSRPVSATAAFAPLMPRPAAYLRTSVPRLTISSPLLARPARAPAVHMVELKARKPATAVYALIMANIVIFILDKVLRLPFVRALYLYHAGWAWWQPLTSCFCHASRSHLSGNVFLLLLFGRSVEDDLGWGGLAFAFAFCGVMANVVSLLILPSMTVSIGASGAVFGLFAVSTLAKLSWNELDWRKLVEVVVLGEFVFGKVMSEIQTAATGGVAGINHVAHLSGAAAGVAMVLLLRTAIAKMD